MNAEQLLDVLKSRRSIRSYKQDEIPQSVIDKILEAGTWAPSAMNMQPWKFVVITDKKLIKELSEKVKKAMLKNEAIMKIARFAERFTAQKDLVFYNAPLVVLITGRIDDEWMKVNTGLAAQNMFLYAHTKGIGSCWIGFAHQLNKDRETLKKLNIDEDDKIYGALIFGYPKGSVGPKGRKPPNIISKF